MTLAEAIDHLRWVAASEDRRAALRDRTIESMRLIVALFPKTRRTLTLLWKALEGELLFERQRGCIVALNDPVPLVNGLEREVGIQARYGTHSDEGWAKIRAIMDLTIEDAG